MDNTFIKDIVEDYDIAVGIKEAPKPGLVIFRNAKSAAKLLMKHIQNKSIIKIHADVDMDGIAATFIMNSFLTDCGMGAYIQPCINKEKVHGVGGKHIEFINKSQASLVIIVDSSTNDTDIIKQFNCDVIVLDHHEVLHNELQGQTANGEYLIVTNMVNNPDDNFKADENMSGAMVVYEFLRLFEKAFCKYSIVEQRQLYQWVGISLFSDAIHTSGNRCMWYMHSTVNAINLEPTLRVLVKTVSKYDCILDKSFINYTLVPLFNKAIRAGESAKALSVALKHPDKASILQQYADIQNNLKEHALENVKEEYGISYRDLTNEGIHVNYAGFLAQEILNKTNNSAFTYINSNDTDILDGHFRGKKKHLDYRSLIESTGLFAQGHKTAFGCRIPRERLSEILKLISENEANYKEPTYLTLGNIRPDIKGIHHIDDFNQFKQAGLLWQLGMLNSYLSSDESINIVATIENAELKEQRGKMWLYDVHGFECKAFEEITTPFINIYFEYSRQLNGYVRNEIGIN